MSNRTHTYIGTFWNIMAMMHFSRAGGVKILCFVVFMLGMLAVPASSSAQVTLSGTVFSDAGVTADGTARTISVAVGTSTPSVFSTTTLTTTGAWTVTIPAGHGIGTSTPIMVWVNDDVTFRATVVTKASSSASVQTISGLDLYQNRIIARHEAVSGTSTTLADFSFYTSVQDSDLQHSTSTAGLRISPGNELYIWSGRTFAPGNSVIVQGNANASPTDGSMYIATSSVYTAGGNLTLGGSLRAASTATFTGGFFTTFFNATTTGKIIDAPIPAIGNVTFNGVGGGWSFTSAATTTALTILQGTVVAPSTTLGVAGVFQNDATFTQSGGVINIIGATTVALGDIAAIANSLDVSGSAGGTISQSITSFVVSGSMLYVGQSGIGTACSQTAGSAQGCELLVFNIASTSNPVYIAGRDSSGSAAGTSTVGINNMIISGNTLYIARAGLATACTQVEGTAVGCELIAFNISSTTNPLFAAGRDADGTAAGGTATAATSLAVSGNALYLSKAAAGGTACTTQANCELMVFDISSTTNPIYATGRDVSGSAAGTGNSGLNNITTLGSALYVVKAGNGTACSQSAGSAIGCEFMIFDISSTTNPTYTRGVDVNGSLTGTGNLTITTLLASGTALYLGTAASSSVCTQTTGSIEGCEIQLYDISSTTNPVFTRGVDVSGSYTGRQSLGVNNFSLSRNYLYVVKAGNATPCVQTNGFTLGCELAVYDVASSSAIRFLTSRDADGSATGTTATAGNAVITIGGSVILGKAAAGTTACSTARLNCELLIFSASTSPNGLLFGALTGSSSIGDVNTLGSVAFLDNADVGNLTIATGTTTAPAVLTVGGNFTNSANYIAGVGELRLSSTSDQTLSGNLTGTNALYRLTFFGSSTKTFGSNASTTFLEINTGATVVAPTQLTINQTFLNNGTYTAGANSVTTSGFLNEFVAGISAGGSASDAQGLQYNALLQVSSTTLYAAKANSNTACSQTAGSAVGCELMVFTIASGTNPAYIAGLDTSGSATGTGNIAINTFAVASNSQTLYVGKVGSGTVCNPTSGNASDCELTIFNIASTTNPIFAGAIDASASSTGSTTNQTITGMAVSGNFLYVAKAGSASLCGQTVGLATGCELMVFDISSTTNPIYRAGRDSDGTASGVSALGATSIAISGNSLYLSKVAAGITACSTTASNCELMVFNISSTTDPQYITGRDTSGSAAGVHTLGIASIAVANNLLYTAKTGSSTACVLTAGSAGGCELMVFNISSTSNPTFVSATDVTGLNTGSGNLGVNFVTATGSLVYLGKAGDGTTCSQTAGSAIGCELMVFDLGSTTNPVYVRGRDADANVAGQTAVGVTALLTTREGSLVTGKAADTTICEQTFGLRTGCELMFYSLPTDFRGVLTDTSSLATVTSNGLTRFLSAASTTQLTIASSSILIAPTTTLSVGGNLTISGSFQHFFGELNLSGTNQTITTFATTTFYDFSQRATASATTTFSANAPFVILRNLTLLGAATSTPLRLRSASSTAQWRIDPQSSTTLSISLLDVKDSNNISATATPLVCGAGCIDSGNNLNWLIGLLVTVSGTLFSEDGLTAYATATPLRLVIPLASQYSNATTSESTTGSYSFSVPDQFLVAGNPYVVYADNTATIKANTVIKSSISGASVSGLDLFRNHVILRSQTTSTPLTNADLFKYTSVDDADIQYTVNSGLQLQVAVPNALMVGDNSSFAPGNTVTVNGTATTTPTVGALFLRNGARYTPTNRTTLAGSFRASSTAQYSPSLSVLEFNATTTGKVIDSQLATLGNVMFNGTGGAWSFTQTNATTSDFDIERGSVTAPSGVLVMNGTFTNNATFNNNSATVRAVGNTTDDNDRAATFVAGRDTQGRSTGNGAQSIKALLINGNYLYRGTNSNGNACAQTTGSGVVGCDLAVFDISSSTNPVYVAGRDGDGSATGTNTGVTFEDFKVFGNYLFISNTGSTTPCGQTPGSALGCELQVYDISSPTNPVYVAGRDADGSAAGTSAIGANVLDIAGDYLFLGKAGTSTACSQTAGAAEGCELMVFDISTPVNPVYKAGRDASGSNTGTGGINIEDMVIQGNNLYVAKFDNNTACNQTAGSAIGCEIMIFSIASTTNPTLVRAIDVLGTDAGILGRTINSIDVNNNTMVIGKDAGGAICEQTAGASHGCEIMIFDISSSTNPVYVAGRDITGDDTGIGSLIVSEVTIHGNNLYVGKEDNTTPCSQVAGQATGCEFMIFDISSTTNPVYVAGRDNSGSKDGVLGRTANEIVARDNVVYVGKNGNTTNCAQTTVGTGAIGCELMVYQSYQPAGVLSGSLTGANAINSLVTNNRVSFVSNASTTNITIATSSIVTSSTTISLSGDFTTSGTFIGQSASGFNSVLFASSSATQTFTGTASSSSTFEDITLGGSGQKNLNLNATTTRIFTVLPGTTGNQNGDLTVRAEYSNLGTFTFSSSSTVIPLGTNKLGRYAAGRDVSGNTTGTGSSGMFNVVREGNYLYVGAGGNGTACAQTAGSAIGCEIQVYDVSSSTNPIYVAGRDSGGSSNGTSAAESPTRLQIIGSMLYVTKTGLASACVETAGPGATGCELIIFDISNPTNPVFQAGRDSSGSVGGVSGVSYQAMSLQGNFLFISNLGSATACAQTAGSAQGCEVQVYDVSVPTNPIFRAGRDVTGGGTGATGNLAVNFLVATGSTLYVSKAGDATACSQTPGSAIGCELLVFDISSSTNPTYIAGRDDAGDSTGTSSNLFRAVAVANNTLYVVKDADGTACSQTAGSSTGCELMVFDVSTPANPLYVAGRDASGDETGIASTTMRRVFVSGNSLYVVKLGNANLCSDIPGSAEGCELMAFNISSTTNPIYDEGLDGSIAKETGVGAVNINNVTTYGGALYVVKDADATACSQSSGNALGCELVVMTIGSRLFGNMTGANTLPAVRTTLGPTQWYNNASATSLTITSGSSVTMPANLSLAGNFSNNGTFYANTGTVTLVGTNQTLSSNATTTFFNLTQRATAAATTTFSSSGSFVTEGTLNLQGTSTNRLKLRSTVDGVQWTILPQGSTTAAWLDVKDSRNASSTIINCTGYCIDRGNNTNWQFFTLLGTGSSTLVQHTAGQVTNRFGVGTSTDATLLAFRLQLNSGSTTYQSLVFDLTGVSGIEANAINNFRLVQDRNSNRVFDGGDVVIGGVGDVIGAGLTGTLGFYEPFFATTSENYLVIADWTPLNNGSFFTIGLSPTKINAFDATGGQTIFGSTVSVQHSRNNRGAGGGSASIGGAAPAGDGDVGGGGSTGGEQMGSNPDFFGPTSNSGSWNSAANAYDGVDGTYATTSSATNHSYLNHGFAIPGGNVIGGIELKIELSGTTGAGSVDVQLSWDGGTSWTSTKSSGTLTTSDAVRTLGSPSDLWGRTWAPGEFSNANFAVRVAGLPSSNTIRLDAIQVRVYHVSGGGGAGGGAGGGGI